MARTLTIGRAIAATLLALAALHPGTDIARAQETSALSVGGYELVNRVRTGRTAFDYTFRGVLSNGGTRNTIGPATATLTSLSPSTQVIDGTLSFPLVPAGGGASSTDTFTIRLDRLLPFDASHLSWSISAEFEEPAPTVERTTIVVIRKITTTPDPGTFTFLASGNNTQTELAPMSISTSGGVGTSAAVFQFDGRDSQILIEELTPPEWTLDGVVCSINGRPEESVEFEAPSSAVRVNVDLGVDSNRIECTFTNRQTAPPTTVMVPLVTGFTQGDAIQAVTAAGLTVGSITHQISNTAFAGIVTGQSPGALAQVAPSTPVNLVVASQQFTFGWGTVEVFDSPGVQSQNGAIATRGRISTPGADIACAPPTSGSPCLIRVDDSGVVCTSGPNGCGVTLSGRQTPVPCASDHACYMLAVQDVVGGPSPVATLVIEKVARTFDGEPADGEFHFGVQSIGSIPDVSIETRGGQGAASLLFSLDEFRLGINIREIVPGAWDQESLTCDHEGFVSVGGGLGGAPQIVTREVDEDAVVRCTFTNRRLPPSTANTTAVHRPEAVTNVPAGAFGLTTGPLVAIAGSSRLEIVNPLTNAIPTAGSTALSLDTRFDGDMYAGLVVKNPAVAGSDALFTIGPGRATTRQFNPDTGAFGPTQVSFPPGENFTDAVPFDGDPNAAGLVVVNYTRNSVAAHVWRNFDGTLVLTGAAEPLASGFNFPGASGPVVSAFGFDLQFDEDGELVPGGSPRLLAITDGTPGQLWSRDPTTPSAPATLIGTVGDSPRRIRCLPARDLCVVGHDDGGLRVFDVSNLAQPREVGNVDVGDGTVGIDLTADGDNTKVISTGFNDNTFTITALALDGRVVSVNTEPAPEGCVNPGHALWLRDTLGTAVLTCTGSDTYAVVNR